MTNIMGMMKITPGLIVLGVCLTGISADEDGDLLKQAQAEFAALPNDAGASEFPTMPERVALGRVLFFDPRLSLD